MTAAELAIAAVLLIIAAIIFFNIKNKRRLLQHKDQNVDHQATLTRAINDAAQMLAYASRSGSALSSSDIESVITAQKAGVSITDAQQTAFWIASSSISRALTPVTLETINSTVSSDGKSLAALVARNYRIRTLITLILLLLFQVYWLIGATVTSDLKEIRVHLEKLSQEGDKGKAASAALSDKDPDYLSKKASYDMELDAWNNKVTQEKISAWADFEVLKNWNVLKRLFIPKNEKPSNFPSSVTKPADQGDAYVVGDNDYFLWIFTPGNAEEIQTSQIVLTALLKYILPILYGALGASAYIVRSLADEIKGFTFSTSSIVRYELRFYLGAVTGLSIAWFTSDPKSADSAGVLQSLSPLALAFLAGYSVELLFSFLDRLASAFSAPQPKQPA